MEIHSPEQLYQLDNGNRILGPLPAMKDSVIRFNGANNTLICEEGVVLERSSINFYKQGSIVFLGRSSNPYKLSVSLYNDNVCYFGRNNYFNGILNVVLSERKHFLVGNDCMFAFGIWVRTADPHLIYRCENKTRINPSKSVFIGDHVWIGQSAFLLKGTKIDSGSIIGAAAVVTGKHVPHNSVWGGSPARQISDGVFWDRACVHAWGKEWTEASMDYERFIEKQPRESADAYIYKYDVDSCLQFDEIDDKIDRLPADQRAIYLMDLQKNDCHNRFVSK